MSSSSSSVIGLSLYCLCQPTRTQNELVQDDYAHADLSSNDKTRSDYSYTSASENDTAGSSSLDTFATMESLSDTQMITSTRSSQDEHERVTIDTGVIYDMKDVPSYHPPSTPDQVIAKLDEMSPVRDALYSRYEEILLTNKGGNQTKRTNKVNVYRAPIMSTIETSTFLAHSADALVDRNKKFESFLYAAISSDNRLEIRYSLSMKCNSSGIYIKETRLKLPEDTQIVCVSVKSVEPPIVYLYSRSFSNGGEILSVNLKHILDKTIDKKIFKLKLQNGRNSEEVDDITKSFINKKLSKLQKKESLPSLFDLAYSGSTSNLDIEITEWMREESTKSIAIVAFPREISRRTNIKCICTYEKGIVVGCSNGNILDASLEEGHTVEPILLKTGSRADIMSIFYIDEYPTCVFIQDCLGNGYLRVLEDGEECDAANLDTDIIVIDDIPSHDLSSRQFLSSSVLMYLTSVHIGKQSILRENQDKSRRNSKTLGNVEASANNLEMSPVRRLVNYYTGLIEEQTILAEQSNVNMKPDLSLRELLVMEVDSKIKSTSQHCHHFGVLDNQGKQLTVQRVLLNVRDGESSDDNDNDDNDNDDNDDDDDDDEKDDSSAKIGNRVEKISSSSSPTEVLFALDLSDLLCLPSSEKVVDFVMILDYALFLVTTSKNEEKVLVFRMETSSSFTLLDTFNIDSFNPTTKEYFIRFNVHQKYNVSMLMDNLMPGILLGFSTNIAFYVIRPELYKNKWIESMKELAEQKQEHTDEDDGAGKPPEERVDKDSLVMIESFPRQVYQVFGGVIEDLFKNEPKLVENRISSFFEEIQSMFYENQSLKDGGSYEMRRAFGMSFDLTKFAPTDGDNHGTAQVEHKITDHNENSLTEKEIGSDSDDLDFDDFESHSGGIDYKAISSDQMILIIGESSLRVDKTCTVIKILHYLQVIRIIALDALGTSALEKMKIQTLRNEEIQNTLPLNRETYITVLNGFDSSEFHDRASVSGVNILKEMLLIMFLVIPSSSDITSKVTSSSLVLPSSLKDGVFSASTLEVIMQSKTLSVKLLSAALRSQFSQLSQMEQLSVYISVEQVDVYLSYVPSVISILLNLNLTEMLGMLLHIKTKFLSKGDDRMSQDEDNLTVYHAVMFALACSHCVSILQRSFNFPSSHLNFILSESKIEEEYENFDRSIDTVISLLQVSVELLNLGTSSSTEAYTYQTKLQEIVIQLQSCINDLHQTVTLLVKPNVHSFLKPDPVQYLLRITREIGNLPMSLVVLRHSRNRRLLHDLWYKKLLFFMEMLFFRQETCMSLKDSSSIETNCDTLLMIAKECLLPIYQSLPINRVSKHEFFIYQSLGYIFSIWSSQRFPVKKFETWIMEEILSLENTEGRDNLRKIFCHGMSFFLVNKLDVLIAYFVNPQMNGRIHDDNYGERFYFQHNQIFPYLGLQQEKDVNNIFDNLLEKFSHEFVSKFFMKLT